MLLPIKNKTDTAVEMWMSSENWAVDIANINYLRFMAVLWLWRRTDCRKHILKQRQGSRRGCHHAGNRLWNEWGKKVLCSVFAILQFFFKLNWNITIEFPFDYIPYATFLQLIGYDFNKSPSRDLVNIWSLILILSETQGHGLEDDEVLILI